MKTSLPTRFSAAAVLAGAASLSCLPASAASLTEALDAAPADAEVVLAFPSLQGFSAMVGRLAETVGVDDEGTDDLLGSFKRGFGVNEGLDEAGAGLLVLTGVNAALEAAGEPGAPEPTAFLVLPVTDYDAMVGSLEKPAEGEAAQTPEGVTAVLLDGDLSVVRRVGSYAVFTEEGGDVAGYEAANAAAAALEAMGGYAADADTSDAAVRVDLAALRGGIAAGIEQMKAEMQAEAEAGPGVQASIAGAFLPILAEAASSVSESADGLLLTARMTPDRVELALATRAKAGSPVAGYLTGDRRDPLPLLGGLPDDPFLTAQAVDLRAIDLAKLTAAVADAARQGVDQMAAQDGMADLAGPLKALVEAWAASMEPAAAAEAVATVNYPGSPQAMMTGGLFQTLSATAAADPAALRAAWPGQVERMEEELVPAVRELMTSLAPEGEPAPELNFTGSYQENALTLAGTEVDRYEMTFALPPELMAGLGPAGFALGNAGQSGFVAVADGTLLQSGSPEPAFMERALLASKGDASVPRLADAASLKGVADTLPEGLVYVSHLSLQGVAQAANPFLMMFLPDAGALDVPADLPPVSAGLGMRAAGNGGQDLGLRLNVPVTLLEFGRDTYQRMAPAAMGPDDGFDGGGGAGGAGQGPPPAPF